jgi:hypothetical protein
MTKKESIQHKAEWQKALSEGRVVRYNNGQPMRSFITQAEVKTFVRAMKVSNIPGVDRSHRARVAGMTQAHREFALYA